MSRRAAAQPALQTAAAQLQGFNSKPNTKQRCLRWWRILLFPLPPRPHLPCFRGQRAEAQLGLKADIILPGDRGVEAEVPAAALLWRGGAHKQGYALGGARLVQVHAAAEKVKEPV